MFNKLIFWLKKPSNTLWVLPTFGVILALSFNLFALLGTIYLKPNILPNIESKTIDDLLNIIASSLLAVSTFSLSIMVSAFASASSNSSPRATELVMADDNTRLAISSFISAFVYAIIAKIGLNTGYYEQNGRFILFISILFVIFYIILMLIRWIHTLSKLGRLDNTLNKIYNATEKSLKLYKEAHNFGACWKEDENIEPNLVLKSIKTGYISYINLNELQNIADKFKLNISILARQGDYIAKNKNLLKIYFEDGSSNIDSTVVDDILNTFIVDIQRSYHQDSRFGFMVLSEVAQKALSPGINDQGTAISVLILISKLLLNDDFKENEEKKNLYNRLSLISFDEAEFIYCSVDAISRDGANNIELSKFVQNILYEIYENSSNANIKKGAKKQAKISLQRALVALSYNEDKKYLQSIYDKNFV
ncbi:DUF2254 domain-containing membrane protein [Campylobacter blaseri]|uniref:DUF2254 domain-containing protein n=1 Tax=Campylobacter blaseri TaxID=2042961 RepID=A0A2P8QYX8_9BACT|nr:DUF2254 family protein [Campylobacter blaseri]PSM51451.1 hypothetical protein CQ405_07730 [Campylobacter blaseri]PSM52900.1 hypothetical protein CRN67_07735 [Campylobacter blaseri]QKF86545.1 DUF2254 domain-containing membrane protein [Campylobacter blaseri]